MKGLSGTEADNLFFNNTDTTDGLASKMKANCLGVTYSAAEIPDKKVKHHCC